MTENEAKQVIETEKSCVMRNISGCDRICEKCDLVMEDKEILSGYDKAISALEEIQQYRTLGTVEEIEPYIRLAEKLNICDLVRENARVNNKLKFMEIKLREAMKKQSPKKPVKISCAEYTHYRCECGYMFRTEYADGLKAGCIHHYCPDCGQAIDWSEEA